MNVVVITGATSGIGMRLATDYVSRGDVVIGIGRNPVALDELALAGIHAISCDITSEKEVCAAITKIRDAYSSIDILILNAGVCHYIEGGNVSADLFQQTFNTNVIAPIRLLEGLMPLLRGVKGHVALISSASVFLPFVRAEAYGASKSAIRYIGHVLRNSLRQSEVEVSTVVLGFIDTPLTQKNKFRMPMLASVEDASHAIIEGLSKKRSEIRFPALFCNVLSLLEKLPLSWRLWLTRKLST